MTPKQDILNAVQQLPEHTSIEDAMERLFILAKMRKGCEEADSGKTVSHAEAEKRMEKWLK
jgi:predicted transcriptional regulator